jgi:hypothetical protein
MKHRMRWAALLALGSVGLLSGCVYYPYGYNPWGYSYAQPNAWGYPYSPGYPYPPPPAVAPNPPNPAIGPPQPLDVPIQRAPLPPASQ